MYKRIEADSIIEWDDFDGDAVHAYGRDRADGQLKWAWVALELIADTRPDLAELMEQGPGGA